jgi:hypothetical protein
MAHRAAQRAEAEHIMPHVAGSGTAADIRRVLEPETMLVRLNVPKVKTG